MVQAIQRWLHLLTLRRKNRALFYTFLYTVYWVYCIPAEVSSKIARIVEGKGGVPIGSEQQVETFQSARPVTQRLLCNDMLRNCRSTAGKPRRLRKKSSSFRSSKQTGKRRNIQQIHYSRWFESSCSNHRSKKGSVIANLNLHGCSQTSPQSSPQPALYGSVTVAPKSVCRKVSRSRLWSGLFSYPPSSNDRNFDESVRTLISKFTEQRLQMYTNVINTRAPPKLPLQAPVKVLQLHDWEVHQPRGGCLDVKGSM